MPSNIPEKKNTVSKLFFWDMNPFWLHTTFQTGEYFILFYFFYMGEGAAKHGIRRQYTAFKLTTHTVNFSHSGIVIHYSTSNDENHFIHGVWNFCSLVLISIRWILRHKHKIQQNWHNFYKCYLFHLFRGRGTGAG